MNWLVTFFCACSICCGEWSKWGLTKSGTTPRVGWTAACPKGMLGSLIHIPTLGIRKCEDTGSKIRGRRVDIFLSSHGKALERGVLRVPVRVVRKRTRGKP